MVELTRLSGEKFTLNAIMIEQIQSLPDTTITLFNGKKIIVKDPERKVMELVTLFYQKIGIQQSVHEVGELRE